ncbi:alpha-L-fucosidase [Granulicella rosea]|uniref:alpha-L-fucosidase n=1 Tax=Granulicella rosea TaxID=474952 RepID=UPI0015958EBE|nr:alpha-L-fucosidase [Granulicella rosea]
MKWTAAAAWPKSWQSLALAQMQLTQAERMQWWEDARFGLFLHWGLYSVAAGVWKGKPIQGAEHFMLYERIPLAQYAQLANGFNPVKFDATAWVRLAKDAGMRYLVITAKHHEGFAMYDSPSSDYNVVKRTPYGRDPMKLLAAACHEQGVKLCFYYSLGRDWQDPDVPTDWPTRGGRSNTWDYPDEDRKVFSRYFERKVKPQVRELLTQYGPVGVLWFDTPELISREESHELLTMIRSLQPACIVNSRIGNGLGDYETSEQTLTPGKPARPWEACMTMSRHWGYFRNEIGYKSPEVLVRDLVEVVSRGGNLLLDIGPSPEGEFPAPAVERLKAIAGWMKINGEAIAGTKPWPAPGAEAADSAAQPSVAGEAVNDQTSHTTEPAIRFTTREGSVYLFALSWRSPQVVVEMLPQTRLRVQRLEMLGAGKAVSWHQDAEALRIQLPPDADRGLPVYVFRLQSGD